MIFAGSYPVLLRTGFIAVSCEVKHPMNHHPSEFFFDRDAELAGILRYPVNTDEDISGNILFHVFGWERDHIRQRIMLQEIAVQIKKVIVVAEDEIDVPGLFLLFKNDGDQPLPVPDLLLQPEVHTLRKKLDL